MLHKRDVAARGPEHARDNNQGIMTTPISAPVDHLVAQVDRHAGGCRQCPAGRQVAHCDARDVRGPRQARAVRAREPVAEPRCDLRVGSETVTGAEPGCALRRLDAAGIRQVLARRRERRACLDIEGGSTGDLAKLIQYTCSGQTNQQFRLK